MAEEQTSCNMIILCRIAADQIKLRHQLISLHTTLPSSSEYALFNCIFSFDNSEFDRICCISNNEIGRERDSKTATVELRHAFAKEIG